MNTTRSVLAGILLLLGPATTEAQTTVQIGTGTQAPLTNNSIYSPMCRFSATTTNDCSRSNLLYTATELANAGITNGATITKISFYKIGTGASTGGFTFQIYMRNSTTTAPLSATTWATILTTHTQVYATTAQTIPSTSGWIDFTLASPFTYTGQSLEIAMSHDMTGISGNPSTGPFDWQYTNGFETYIIGAVSTSLPANLNGTVVNYKVRPNIQIEYNTPLSAGLLSFNATKQASAHRLTWETAEDLDARGFDIEHSTDGASFSTLGFVPRELNGKHTYLHQDPAKGVHFYRLKQLGQNGSYHFSKVLTLRTDLAEGLAMDKVYPHPATDVLHLVLTSSAMRQASVQVVDMTGKVVSTQQLTIKEGMNKVQLSVADLADGNYTLHCTGTGCSSITSSFVKQSRQR